MVALGDASSEGSRPVPDPTILTTQALEREISSLRTYIDSQNQTQDERLRGIDKATALRLDIIHSIIPDVEKLIAYERLLTEGKFESVAQQFKERDTRSERESRDNALKVDAAFAAQEKQAAATNEANQKAIDKSEAATNESIKKADDTGKAANAALADKIDDIKTRIGIIDATMVGLIQRGASTREASGDSRSTIAILLSAAALVAVIIGQILITVGR